MTSRGECEVQDAWHIYKTKTYRGASADVAVAMGGMRISGVAVGRAAASAGKDGGGAGSP